MAYLTYSVQEKEKALIIAEKKGTLVYPGAKVCQSFGNEHFYYTSLVKNCIFDCDYCYLQGMYPSANLVVFNNIEDMNLEELESMKEDADDMNAFIDKLESSTNEELDDINNNLSMIKSLVDTIENNTSGGLKLMWSQLLKGLVEDDTFKSLSEDELHKMADNYNVSYDLLKWLQDNAEINLLD